MVEDYVKLLKEKYKNKDEVMMEIINLEAIMSLPKGTEHFITDLHGEYETFDYLLRSASGVLKIKIEENFSFLTNEEKLKLATLIFYPEKILKEKINEFKIRDTIINLIDLVRIISSKYTKSKIRKAVPDEYGYIIEELLTTRIYEKNKDTYYEKIIETIINLAKEKDFILVLCNLIQRLAVDKLHIIGDIYDRGNDPHKIIDKLTKYHNLDIQWGNHDILWLGAFLGNKEMICNVVRISFRYNNKKLLEDIYGINLLPLGLYATKIYRGKINDMFLPKNKGSEDDLIAKMHKVISIIQFKLESKRDENHIFNKINFDDFTYEEHGKKYKLKDTEFPSVDKKDRHKLTYEEEEILEKLTLSFINSYKLRKHMDFLYKNSSMYKIYNNNLLFHGCIPLNKDGSLRKILIDGKVYSGKKLMDYFDKVIKKAYLTRDKIYIDKLLYLWNGAFSPLFGKKKMATFERYFFTEKSLHKEIRDNYYSLREEESVANRILNEFGKLEGVIINGHTPIDTLSGEKPIKANGKLICIDGGFNKSYQKKTRVGGYTLIYNSYGLRLASHKPFASKESILESGLDIIDTIRVVDVCERKYVRDTCIGKGIKGEVEVLKKLLEYF